MLYINMFSARMVCGILCKCYASLIVARDGCRSFLNISHIRQKLPTPNRFLRAMASGRVLCLYCRAPLHEECPKHHGHKGDPGATPGTCGTIGERAQVILVWVRTPGNWNASHSWRLVVTRVSPWFMCSLWRGDSRMLKNTSIGGVS